MLHCLISCVFIVLLCMIVYNTFLLSPYLCILIILVNKNTYQQIIIRTPARTVHRSVLHSHTEYVKFAPRQVSQGTNPRTLTFRPLAH